MENSLLRQRIVRIIIPLIMVVAIAAAGYFYWQMHLLKQNPQVVAQEEVSDLVAKVSNLMVLPTGEIPTIATVSDPSALKDQAFFALAAKGDKVLIYAQAKKAILYSVALNKIIDVAPLNIGAQPAVTPPAATTSTSTATPAKKK
jgi:hypothetical protein